MLETAARGGGLAGSHAARHRLICSTCNSLTPVNHRRRKGKGQLYSTEEGSRVRLSLTCRLQPSSGSTQTSVPVLGHETSCPGTCMYPPPSLVLSLKTVQQAREVKTFPKRDTSGLPLRHQTSSLAGCYVSRRHNSQSTCRRQ